jgi:hypothetical protein
MYRFFYLLSLYPRVSGEFGWQSLGKQGDIRYFTARERAWEQEPNRTADKNSLLPGMLTSRVEKSGYCSSGTT